MSDIASKTAEVKDNLRALLLAYPDPVDLRRLSSDYRNSIGVDIPFRELGYGFLVSFIRDIPDCVTLIPYYDRLFVTGVADESTEHISNLVSGQKRQKRGRANLPRRGTPPFRPRPYSSVLNYERPSYTIRPRQYSGALNYEPSFPTSRPRSYTSVSDYEPPRPASPRLDEIEQSRSVIKPNVNRYNEPLIPAVIIRQIKHLLDIHPCGIDVKDFGSAYCNRFNTTFNPRSYGFSSYGSLVSSLTEVVKLKTSGDGHCIMYSASAPCKHCLAY